MEESSIELRVGYRQPFRFGELLSFFGARSLVGVEMVDERSYSRAVRLALSDKNEVCGWIRVEDDSEQSALVLSMSESLAPASQMVVARVKRLFDLDCDPKEVYESLATLDEIRPGSNVCGTRLPGCFDPFETCCRAVLGQQISVVAANKMAARVADALGEPLDTGIEGLSRLWPTPVRFLELDDAASVLGPLGVIRSRAAAIIDIARKVETGELRFDAHANVEEMMETLLSIKGIGPWTANYIAMRAFSYPDAFLEKDAGVVHALPDLTPKERLVAVEPCRPWRSYAVINLWNSL